MNNIENNIDVKRRNYGLDFLKLLLTFLIFWVHTSPFKGKSTNIRFPFQLGEISVHCFFIISGMLMANSIARKKKNIVSPGKSAVSYVLKKAKQIGGKYFCGFLICLIVSIYTYIYSDENSYGIIGGILYKVTRIFPEIFYLSASGIWLDCNKPTWYISAMFICMLPLAYLLYKKRDFTLYVFAPITSILIYGWICKSNLWEFISADLYGYFTGSLIKAMCGLCFGICAYTIYARLRDMKASRSMRVLLTFVEALLYIIFFGTWFVLWYNYQLKTSIMSVILLLPIAVAITFSGKSYITGLFRFKWMSIFAPLSLIIYLNHWAARELVLYLYKGKDYWFCVGKMAMFTTVFCVANVLIVSCGKYIWKTKLKSKFFPESSSEAQD